MAKKTKGSGSIENEHLAAILCYFIVGIIWYFADEVMKKSSFVNFHSKQAINLWIFSAGIGILASFMLFMGGFVRVVGGIFVFVLWIIGLINALNAKQKEVPIIGQFAEKYLTY
jgi:uncharacterized membrane protein